VVGVGLHLGGVEGAVPEVLLGDADITVITHVWLRRDIQLANSLLDCPPLTGYSPAGRGHLVERYNGVASGLDNETVDDNGGTATGGLQKPAGSKRNHITQQLLEATICCLHTM
jgi:hypothetical protein